MWTDLKNARGMDPNKTHKLLYVPRLSIPSIHVCRELVGGRPGADCLHTAAPQCRKNDEKIKQVRDTVPEGLWHQNRLSERTQLLF